MQPLVDSYTLPAFPATKFKREAYMKAIKQIQEATQCTLNEAIEIYSALDHQNNTLLKSKG